MPLKVKVLKSSNELINPTVSRYINIKNLIPLSGAASKEEYDTFVSKQSALSDYSHNGLKKFISMCNQKIEQILLNYFSDVKKFDDAFYYNYSEIVSENVLKKVKEENLNIKAAKSLISNNDRIFIPPYINSYENMDKKPIIHHAVDDVFIHNRSQLKFIIGELTIAQQKASEAKRHKYNNTSIKELLYRKNEILIEIGKYLKKNKSMTDFAFSNQEIKCLKDLAIEYDTINNLLLEKNINTVFIDKLLTSDINYPLQKGDILPNKDKVIKFSEVHDKDKRTKVPTIITFANCNNGFRFKSYIYDMQLLSQKSAYSTRYKQLIDEENIEELNTLNKEIENRLKDNNVAEVYVEKLDKDSMSETMEKSNSLPKDLINMLLENKEEIFLIKSLKNFNREKFYNVALPLIQCLKEFANINNIKEAFAEARAYNHSQHSPIALYLHAGGEPISDTKEHIEELISEKKLDYKKGIWLLFKL